MLELYHGTRSVCAQKARWERVKSRPSYDSAVTKWLRPEDIARDEKIADPWPSVSNNLA